jgi:putative hemolysin
VEGTLPQLALVATLVVFDAAFARVEHEPDGSLVLAGSFSVHDLADLGVELPEGDYPTVAGPVPTALGRIPERPGDVVAMTDGTATVLVVDHHAITSFRLSRGLKKEPSGRHQPAPAGRED